MIVGDIRKVIRVFRPQAIAQDLRDSLRAIRHTIWLSLAVVVTLATGIGMNSVVFSAFNGLLFRPSITRDPGSYVELFSTVSGRGTRELDGLSTLATPEEYEILRDSTHTLSAVTASRWALFTLGDGHGSATASVRGRFVSCNFLTAQVGPMRLGRGLLDADCLATAGAPVGVLTERGWTLYFGRDPNIIGRVIRLNDRLVTIVGVAPDDAVGPMATLVYVPYTLQPLLRGPIDFFRGARDRYAWLSLSGRLAPGRTLAEAQAEMHVIAGQIDRLHPGQTSTLQVTDGALIHTPDSSRTMPILVALCLGTTLLILLTVCANVGTLLLARAVARRHEMAVRLALGAGRAQLLRQLLLETVLLGIAAAIVSLGLVWYVPLRMLQMLTDFPLLDVFGPDWRVFGFTFAIAFIAGAIAGLSPAIETLRVSPSEILKAGGPSGGAPISARLRGLLITNQLSVSLGLLIAIGLFVRAQDRLLATRFEFDPTATLMTSLDLPHFGYAGPAARGFYDRLLPAIASIPGVRAVALSSPPPFTGISRKALRRDPRAATVVASVRAVSPEYFAIVGVRLLEGRLFTEQETRTRSALTPVIVSDSFARMLFPAVDGLGRRLTFADDTTAEIIGIVSDTTSIKPTARDEALMYHPISEADAARITPIVQFTGDARTLAQSVRAAVQTIDPRIVSNPETLATSIARDAAQYATILKLTSVPAGLALFLSLIGIYGVTMFAAAQRTHEIGIRIALGANTGDIVRLFLQSLYKPLLLGILCGSGLAAVSILLLRTTRLGLDLSVHDPLPYGIAIIVLIAAASIATTIPALRAARKQPWIALSNASRS
jgi:predicted permease